MNRFASPGQVMVLWGHGCNEAVAAGFVTLFRQQGANVALVGLSGRRNIGAHGLALQPDLLLSEALALADKVDLVILPCGEGPLAALDTDPRLRSLCRRAQANGADFLISEEAVRTLLDLNIQNSHLFTFDPDPFSFLEE